jgi:hypothetical protein
MLTQLRQTCRQGRSKAGIDRAVGVLVGYPTFYGNNLDPTEGDPSCPTASRRC